MPLFLAKKPAYICGPLTELNPAKAVLAQDLYSAMADVLKETTGIRAFVPHEHYDPILHANFTAREVYEAESAQVMEHTSLLVIVPIAPSWGGGIEAQMANFADIPAIVVKEDHQKLSRLLMGLPNIKRVVHYDGTHKDAIRRLRQAIACLTSQASPTVPSLVAS